jgi:hypothetical protein
MPTGKLPARSLARVVMPGEDRETVYFRARRAGRKTASGIVAERLTSRPDQRNCRPENTGAVKTETGIAPENRNGVTIMARTPATATAPHAARSAADTATTQTPRPVAPAAGDSPAAAVLAALSADPAGAAVAAVAARAGISVPAARQALLACEKNGTATRVKGSRPGIPDTWTTAAAPEAPAAEAAPAEAPADEPAGSPAGASQPAPAPADATAEGQQAEADTGPGPDPAVTAEAAGSVAAIAQAADEARKALAAGNLDVALAALEAARDLAAQGRRAVKAAASGRRAPATRPGALRDLVEEHLRKFPDAAFTPHQIGKVLTRSAGAVANGLDKLVSLGVAQMVTDKPRTYQLAPATPAPAPDAVGDPGTSAETAPSAV